MTRLAVLVASIAIVLAACGPSPSPSLPAASGSGEPPAGGPGGGATLTVGLAAEAESLDPALAYQSAGQSPVYAIFDTILTIAPDGTLGPGLAETWEVVDPTTIELALREDVSFHGGEEPFDAESVRFSILRIMDRDPVTGEPIADDAAKLNSQWSRDFGAVDEVEVVDEATVRITLTRPDVGILDALGRTFAVPPEYVGRVGNDGFAQAPVGTGPFLFEELVKDDHTTLTRNPDYWPSPRGEPLVDTVVFRPIPDASTRLNELLSGGVDLIADPSPDQIDRIEEAGGRVPTTADARRYMIWFSTDGKGALAENPDKTPAQATALEALAKPEVRLALNLAVDREAIIETLLQGRGEPMTGIFVPGDLGYDADVPPFDHDPDLARQLLADAGYPDGFEVDLDVCTCDRSDLPEAVAGELAKIGVRVNLKPAEISQFNADWGAGRTNPMRASRLSFSDVNVYLNLWLRSDGFLSRFGDPAIDELIEEQAAEYAPAEREVILHDIGERTREAAPALFLWSSPNLYGAAPTIPDWQPHLLGYLPVVGVEVAP